MPLADAPRPDQAVLATRFAAFCRRASQPPPAAPPCAAEEAARRLLAARRETQAAHSGWSRVRRLLARLRRVWQRRDLSWRGKVLATPGLGAFAQWGVALVRLARFRAETLQALAGVAAQQARLEAMLQSLTERNERQAQALRAQLTALAERQAALGATDADAAALPAEVYLALEERLRGAREAVAERFEVYLPYVERAARLGPAADLGCGRGEWLDRLARAGWSACGVDANAAMVATCRARGLSVEQGDALAWLIARAPASLGLVSLFHVAEHLSVADLFALLRAAWTALAPGGVLIVETPNPENLQVAAYSFWLDPTHRRPLPPPLLDVLTCAAGFRTLEIVRLAPWPEFAQEDAAYPPYLRKLLFCGQDYGLIAVKPSEASS